MFLGLDGIEVSLIITFLCLLSGILTGFPVAFALAGSALISFGIIAALAQNGLLMKEVVDQGSAAYQQLISSGIKAEHISKFNHPEIPTILLPLFERGLDDAINRTISFIVNRMNERVFAGPSIETLLAVAMFVLMGIALERSRIANDLLTTMARVFGPLPGGLAVSVVVVGAFLAASTGIVGATVVTMGLLSLPTMLKHKYSPELATGVINASGTLGQIIPPSIVIVLLGTLAGDIYATAQETRAKAAGCSDALTFLGEPAVLSVGTLFKAAILPGVFLAFLYGLYAFGYALWKPHKAPPVHFEESGREQNARHSLLWFLIIPLAGIVMTVAAFTFHVAGSQEIVTGANAFVNNGPELRTAVSPTCKASMIELHGQDKWDRSVAKKAELAASANSASEEEAVDLTNDEEVAKALQGIAPLSGSVLILTLLMGLALSTAHGVRPEYSPQPLLIGAAGLLAFLAADLFIVHPLMSPGKTTFVYLLPVLAILYGLRHAAPRLAEVDILRVVFPPLVLIVAVLGSILGGITNPTPAAALGAVGAIMLAAQRKLADEGRSQGSMIMLATAAIVVFLLVGVNFDLRTGVEVVGFENWVAIIITLFAFHIAVFGLIYACWVLWSHRILTPIVRESAKVTAMVFAILVGSQMLNLVLISFGGEDYIQTFLRSFEEEWVVFLLVMAIMFVLGFVLDFLEIIYIVVPIVGPVIYGGTLDPAWVTIMITINLQTSFLTPPFGFALFYLRGVAPPEVTTGHIYRGVVPFIVIQVIGLGLLWLFPSIVTIVPDLLPQN
jgi:TRAP-type mannitol/chloroaromatic compound transport system permease large subunit